MRKFGILSNCRAHSSVTPFWMVPSMKFALCSNLMASVWAVLAGSQLGSTCNGRVLLTFLEKHETLLVDSMLFFACVWKDISITDLDEIVEEWLFSILERCSFKRFLATKVSFDSLVRVVDRSTESLELSRSKSLSMVLFPKGSLTNSKLFSVSLRGISTELSKIVVPEWETSGIVFLMGVLVIAGMLDSARAGEEQAISITDAVAPSVGSRQRRWFLHCTGEGGRSRFCPEFFSQAPHRSANQTIL